MESWCFFIRPLSNLPVRGLKVLVSFWRPGNFNSARSRGCDHMPRVPPNHHEEIGHKKHEKDKAFSHLHFSLARMVCVCVCACVFEVQKVISLAVPWPPPRNSSPFGCEANSAAEELG